MTVHAEGKITTESAFFHAHVTRVLKGRGRGRRIRDQGVVLAPAETQGTDRRAPAALGACGRTRGMLLSSLAVPAWSRVMRVVVYRKRVRHRTPKSYQLDTFDPDDGYFEYSAIVTNKEVTGRTLRFFMCRGGTHEKVYPEFNGGFAFICPRPDAVTPIALGRYSASWSSTRCGPCNPAVSDRSELTLWTLQRGRYGSPAGWPPNAPARQHPRGPRAPSLPDRFATSTLMPSTLSTDTGNNPLTEAQCVPSKGIT